MNIPTPYYIVYEERLRHNLSLIKQVADEAGIEIIMALKANALWKTFPIIAEYGFGSTASSINEMRLSLDYLKGKVHAYCPVYTSDTFVQFLEGCSHITFNSLNQYEINRKRIEQYNTLHTDNRISAGLRVNPRCSIVDTDIYNPCLPGSRFGITADKLPENLPGGIDGLHFHALCESDSYDLEKLLDAFETQYRQWIPRIKWVNIGGGHLMTKVGYNTSHLIRLLKNFKQQYPHLHLIMEPGSAFTWRTGDLVTTVLDIVEDSGVRTAIIDASFACHMPDCLEMPYKPTITESLNDDANSGISYRLGGNSCLSGDFTGDWKFASPLKPGEKLTLEDMNHYTTVKTNMFNGIQHPSIWFKPISGEPRLLKEYTYEDYRDRMD